LSTWIPSAAWLHESVAERPPLAQRLESTDVVQQAAQPCEVDVGRGQALPSRDLVAQLGNLIGVFDLERDTFIRNVVTSDISIECI